MRWLLFFLLLVFGCAEVQLPRKPIRECARRAIVFPWSHTEDAYTCDGRCPRFPADVRDRPGFHVMSVIELRVFDEDVGEHGTLKKWMHVEDGTCHHFYCRIDRGCLADARSEIDCMQTTNCIVAYTAE